MIKFSKEQPWMEGSSTTGRKYFNKLYEHFGFKRKKNCPGEFLNDDITFSEDWVNNRLELLAAMYPDIRQMLQADLGL